MPAKDKEDFTIGHNEETFEYFTKLAKEHKAQILKQNEELSELRADTSIEKQEMANANRLKLAGMKPKTNGKGN